MSTNDISRYLVKANGSSFASDNELQSLAVNSKVTNVNSGLTYKKTALNVYDKTPIEVETDAVLYSPQTLTNAQKLQARDNIGASSSDAVLYTAQSLTDAQKAQARNNIGAGSPTSDAVLYTSQTLTDAQKTQARNNIGAGKSESVLYTPQTLTDAQKLIARTNIETLSSSEIKGLLKSLTNYSFSSVYAKIIDIGDFRIVYGYTYSSSNGDPKRMSRSMIAEFGGYFDEIPVMLSTHILGWTHGGEQNAQGVLRNSMSPGYGCVVYYDGNQLECASYIALGRPFKENHIPLSYQFGTSEGTYSAILQDVKINSTIILEMYARADSQTTIEVVKSDSSGVQDLTTTDITYNLHKYGWRNNEIKVSGDVYDYSVVKMQDNRFIITGRVSDENLNEYRKIVYRLVANSSNVSLKFSKTGDQDGYILLRYSVNTPTTD